MEDRKWEELPFDCLVSIFSKLDLEDLLTLRVSLVCKSFHAASMDPQCWKILDFQDLDIRQYSKFILKFKHENHVNTFSYHSLVKLCFARSHGSAIKLSFRDIDGCLLILCLTMASIQCPKLKMLTLPIMYDEDAERLLGLIGKWKELETLELNWKPISFLDLVEEIRANCPKFNELRLRGIIDNEDAMAIARNLPGLKRLAITSVFRGVKNLVTILDGCAELRVVDLSYSRGFDWDEEMLKPFSAKIKKFKPYRRKVHFQWLIHFPDWYQQSKGKNLA